MPLRFLLLWLTCGLLLLAACSAPEAPPAADYLTRIPDPKTLGEAYVSNPDGLLAPATLQDLNATLQALDQSGRAHIDVVAVRSIGEEVPKTAVTALFNRWKIGDKDRNNGLLLLLVLDQRRVEMETGYGLEADLPDVTCFRIQQQYMVPLLREERYDEAVRQGVAALIRQLSSGSAALVAPADSALVPEAALQAAPEATPEPVLRTEQPDTSWSTTSIVAAWILGVVWAIVTLTLALQKPPVAAPRWVLWLSLAVVPLYIALAVFTPWPLPGLGLLALCYGFPLLYMGLYLRRVNQQFARQPRLKPRPARYQFLTTAHHQLGFLAVLYPLPLAAYWFWHRRRLHHLRTAPLPCPHCATAMHRLDEQADDQHIQPGQVVEEQLQAVDYDVWACPQCQHTIIYQYQNLHTAVEVCSKCHHRTAEPQPDQEMKAASTSSSGWGWHIHLCRFCGHETRKKYLIPRLSTSSSGSSSSSSSDSSSSSSSSSGGSSGGGGAGSSW